LHSRPETQPEKPVAVLVIGTERGLCGRFNTALVEQTQIYVDERQTNTQLFVLGSRVRSALERHGHPITWASTLSTTALPSPDVAHVLSSRWLTSYEAHEIGAVDLIHNAHLGMGSYTPTVTRLIPATSLHSLERAKVQAPPIIIETDPQSLYKRLVEQWTATQMYQYLLQSAAAEHAARYELMEAATQNTERLIDELTLAIQSARQQAITREMQELAVGAGLIAQAETHKP
jgi:F-type H+-transporting ATPase subunit gamma